MRPYESTRVAWIFLPKPNIFLLCPYIQASRMLKASRIKRQLCSLEYVFIVHRTGFCWWIREAESERERRSKFFINDCWWLKKGNMKENKKKFGSQRRPTLERCLMYMFFWICCQGHFKMISKVEFASLYVGPL